MQEPSYTHASTLPHFFQCCGSYVKAETANGFLLFILQIIIPRVIKKKVTVVYYDS